MTSEPVLRPPVLRRLGPTEAAGYRAIRLLTLRTEPEAFGTLAVDEAAKPPAHFVQALVADTVLGAFVDGAIVGTARLHRATGAKERHKGSLHGIFVDPAHRGRGLGAALVGAALATATDLEQVTLQVVAGNAAAIALYERMGFQRYGLEPRARKHLGAYTDILLMVRLLP